MASENLLDGFEEGRTRRLLISRGIQVFIKNIFRKKKRIKLHTVYLLDGFEECLSIVDFAGNSAQNAFETRRSLVQCNEIGFGSHNLKLCENKNKYIEYFK